MGARLNHLIQRQKAGRNNPLVVARSNQNTIMADGGGFSTLKRQQMLYSDFNTTANKDAAGKSGKI
jgi:hypothetical protein